MRYSKFHNVDIVSLEEPTFVDKWNHNASQRA